MDGVPLDDRDFHNKRKGCEAYFTFYFLSVFHRDSGTRELQKSCSKIENWQSTKIVESLAWIDLSTTVKVNICGFHEHSFWTCF
jgi:hypothetical protein